ncbi:EamA family transporter [Mycobacterium sp. MBM]|nr:EamA family transporter [Mycobacterium sp. MBM]
MTMTDARSTNRFRLGLVFAIASAFAFGVSGPLAKSLMEAGWTPTAAVTARLAGGALAMAVFASFATPGWAAEAWAHRRTILAYGVFPVAGAQFCYYNAVSHLSVGVALLLEYTAPILVVGWLWARTRRRPSTLTLAGVAIAITGITLVLDVFAGAHINSTGVVWGLAAAVCAACYFMMSEKASSDGTGLNPITLAAAGLIVGAVTVAALGVSGLMPMRFSADAAVLAGFTVPWFVPVIGLALIPTAIAYTLGIMGVSRLRPRFASLVGLSEVLFAVLAAWALLAESITVTQTVGGAVVLLGLALARQGDRTEQVAQAEWPDVAPVPMQPEQPISRS